MMKKLTKELLETPEIPEVVERIQDKTVLPERVVQFGEGNFLRGFVDWMIHQLNKRNLFNGRIVAIQPTPHGKVVPKLNVQDGLYTFVLQGIENGIEVEKYKIISSISRGINPYVNWAEVLKVAESAEIQYVFSNTTEAGITYIKEPYDHQQSPSSFPGKLTSFLFHRFIRFNGEAQSGLTIIPCELVENNGDLLKHFVLNHAEDWNLGEAFIAWVDQHNTFCNTLVDRIVPGFPKKNIHYFQDVLGYEDVLIGVGEPYHLFAIDADDTIKDSIPFHQAGLNVKWGDVSPYRQLKVSLLNAPHTSVFSIGYLSGLNTVFEVMEDAYVNQFVKKLMFDEILPVVDFDENEKSEFANAVMERFSNPFVEHQLNDIGLNAISKFRTRVLPLLLRWVDNKKQVPELMTFSFAALFVYFRPVRMIDEEHMAGMRNDEEYTIRDAKETITALAAAWKRDDIDLVVLKILENEEIWGANLAKVNGLPEAVSNHLKSILHKGMQESLQQLLEISVSKGGVTHS
jgi:tagaturonate reductase